ncbi:MAG: GIDE domain-containing protein, partial [Prochloraceae cyanobacterium]
MFVLGLILLLVAAYFVQERRNTLSQLRPIEIIKTSTVAGLQDVSQAIENELGATGFFKEQVGVKGVIHSNNPIAAQLSERPCVYVRTQIVEKYEESYYNDGKRLIRQGSTTLANNTLKTNFELEDDTGRIQVNQDGAEIEAIEVVNRYEQNQDLQGFENKRILGYQYNEWILPLDTKVYVVGEVSNSESELVIQNPSDSENDFLITHKSQEQLVQEKQARVQTLQAQARKQNAYIISLALAVTFTLVGLFHHHQTIAHQIHAIKTIATSKVVELQKLTHTSEKELGKVGTIEQQVEVKGKVRSNNPIVAGLSERPCVYARTQILEKYEETYVDDDGKRQTRQETTTLANNTLKTNFELEDDTGRIQVNQDGAEIEAIEVVDRYEPNQNQNHQESENKRILGYQYNEWILPLDTKVYVMGELSN